MPGPKINISGDIIQVAVPVPLRQVFDYLKPAHDQPPMPGCRVRVPFGHRKLVGLVVAVKNQSTIAREKLKTITQVLDQDPLIEPAQLKFLQWAASYYHHPLGEVIEAALPVTLRQGQAAAVAGVSEWLLTERGLTQIGRAHV